MIYERPPPEDTAWPTQSLAIVPWRHYAAGETNMTALCPL